MRFAFVPYHESEAPPPINLSQGTDTVALRVGTTQVWAWWGAGVNGRIASERTTEEGQLLIKTQDSRHAEKVICR